MRTGIYCRISSDRTGKQAGVDRQRDECQVRADKLGWEVVSVFVDNDISATYGKHRPQYAAMLDGIATGEIEAVIAWHPDRLYRRPTELEEFINLVDQHGTQISTVQTGLYDLGTPGGRMQARIGVAIAMHETEHKSERQRSEGLALAKTGQPNPGGPRPFGFLDDKITHHPVEAPAIRKAVDQILDGRSAISIFQEWNDAGLRSSSGAMWKASTFTSMIYSPRNVGLRTYHREVLYVDGEPVKAAWEPIIAMEQYEALMALHTKRRRKRGRPYSYLLTGGISVCGICGHRLHARPVGDGRPAMVCSKSPGFDGCGGIKILAGDLEDYIKEAVLQALDGPGLAAAVTARDGEAQTDVSELAAEVSKLESSLEQLASDHYTDQLIDRKEFFAARSTIQSKLDALNSEIAQVVSGRVSPALSENGTDLRSLWDEQDIDWRRRLVKLVIGELIVHPAVRGRNFFDPDRIEIVWRV